MTVEGKSTELSLFQSPNPDCLSCGFLPVDLKILVSIISYFLIFKFKKILTYLSPFSHWKIQRLQPYTYKDPKKQVSLHHLHQCSLTFVKDVLNLIVVIIKNIHDIHDLDFRISIMPTYIYLIFGLGPYSHIPVYTTLP